MSLSALGPREGAGARHFLFLALTKTPSLHPAPGVEAGARTPRPGGVTNAEGRGNTHIWPYMGSHVTGRALIHIKRCAAGGIPGFLGQRVAGLGAELAGREEQRRAAPRAGRARSSPGHKPRGGCSARPRRPRAAGWRRHEGHVARRAPAAQDAPTGGRGALRGARLPALPGLRRVERARLAQRQPQLGGAAAGPGRRGIGALRVARRGGARSVAAGGRRRRGGGGRAGPGQPPLAEAAEGERRARRAHLAAGLPARRPAGLLP